MTTKIPVELSSTPGIVDSSNATAITISSAEKVTFAKDIEIQGDSVSGSEGGHITLRAASGGSKEFGIDVDSSNRLRIITEDDGTGDNGAVVASIENDKTVHIGGSYSYAAGAAVLHLHQADATSNAYLHITQEDGGSAATDGMSIGVLDGGANASIRLRENGYLNFYTNNTEAMRLHSTGKLTVGASTSASNGVIEANYTGNAFTLWLTATQQNYLGFESTETGGQAWSFRTAGSGNYGSANGDLLVVNGSGGEFLRFDQSASTVNGDLNDTSDIGLKENIADTTDGLTKLLQLRARKFDWKGEDKRNNVNGFIAQEVETVLPDEVIGDDYNPEKPQHGHKAINTSGLLAVAVKAIQEQQTIIDDLKARIETLEG